MATPVTHLYFTQQVSRLLFQDRNETSLVLGTSFPDIRHLAKLFREQTHYLPSFEEGSNDFLL